MAAYTMDIEQFKTFKILKLWILMNLIKTN